MQIENVFCLPENEQESEKIYAWLLSIESIVKSNGNLEDTAFLPCHYPQNTIFLNAWNAHVIAG